MIILKLDIYTVKTMTEDFNILLTTTGEYKKVICVAHRWPSAIL
jgi:hypothetical protein